MPIPVIRLSTFQPTSDSVRWLAESGREAAVRRWSCNDTSRIPSDFCDYSMSDAATLRSVLFNLCKMSIALRRCCYAWNRSCVGGMMTAASG
jgi:hypothetical protein